MKNYLLYIDILGFKDLVKKDKDKVDLLYKIIDNLNIHAHSGFKVIIFSDTVLVYPDFNAKKDDEHKYATMYLVEFTQDLFYRATNEGLFFRAIIDYGDFTFEELKHCDKYFGEALINCYEQEKKINSIGTFITNEAAKHQSIFPMGRFSSGLQFVYFQQQYYMFSRHYNGFEEVPWDLVDQEDYTYPMVREMIFFKRLINNARRHQDPNVRTKYLHYLEYYRKRYPWPLKIWESEGFGMNKIVPSNKWGPIYRKVLEG